REIPMISRDGQMIAGRAEGSKKTEIYKINMPSGNCESIAKIPTKTSKVSFTFDNKSVLYVIKDPNTGFGRLTQFDIASGKAKTLSGPDEDVMYTTAKKDGSIFYTRRKSMTQIYEEASDLVELAPNSVP